MTTRVGAFDRKLSGEHFDNLSYNDAKKKGQLVLVQKKNRFYVVLRENLYNPPVNFRSVAPNKVTTKMMLKHVIITQK